MKSVILLAGVWLAMHVSLARAVDDGTFPKADTRDKFAEIETAVLRGMAEDGRYRFVSRGDRLVVEHELGLMQAAFARRATTAEMSDDERLALFNSQERINGILARNDAERLVCTTERPIGSNIPVRSCKTYARVRRDQYNSDDYKRLRQFVPCRDDKVCPWVR
jgi:hypothetical protein